MRNRWWAAPLAAGAAALIAACGSSGTPSASHSTTTPPAAQPSATPQGGSHASTVTIMTHTTSQGTVLANGQGMTIYWFAKDSSTASNCTGSCAAFWPPVIGMPTAAAGTSLPKGFGTITRSDGQLQATYNGHPLYTYMGDSAPGQITGNAKNLSGGLWWAMPPSGAKLSRGSTSPPAGGGGGYGY